MSHRGRVEEDVGVRCLPDRNDQRRHDERFGSGVGLGLAGHGLWHMFLGCSGWGCLGGWVLAWGGGIAIPPLGLLLASPSPCVRVHVFYGCVCVGVWVYVFGVYVFLVLFSMSPPVNVRRCGITLDPLLRSCAGLLCRASTSDAVGVARKCRTGGVLKKTWACALYRTVTTKEDTTRGLARVLGWYLLDMY